MPFWHAEPPFRLVITKKKHQIHSPLHLFLWELNIMREENTMENLKEKKNSLRKKTSHSLRRWKFMYRE